MKRLETLIKENNEKLAIFRNSRQEFATKLELVNQEIFRLEGEARLLKKMKQEQEPKKQKEAKNSTEEK